MITNAILKEIRLRKPYLRNETIETIYFGGGTPSVLTPDQLSAFLETISEIFTVSNTPEITLEANPDDLNPQYLHHLNSIGINRLSIGIQSFHNPMLQFMNRAHNAKEAVKAYDYARKAGFNNISIDLIYGIPSDDHKTWNADLEMAMQLFPEHISAYCLTIEPNTVLGHWEKQKKFKQVDESFAARQFELLIHSLEGMGYEQYEVSNFARDQYYSRHNTSYWNHKKYLGIGPSAHSYDFHSRQYNIANNARYLKAIDQGFVPVEIEELDNHTRINEYLMTGLRTIWGCNLAYLKTNFNYDLLQSHQSLIEQYKNEGLLIIDNDRLKLTKAGFLFADQIASEFFKD